MTASTASMRQLRLRPEGFLSWAYVLEAPDGQVVGRVRLGWWGEKGSIRLGRNKVDIERKSLFGGEWTLATHPPIKARKPSMLSREFVIVQGSRRLSLKPRGLTRRFDLIESGRVIGSIQPAAWFSRKGTAEFELDLPPELALVAVFLSLLMWKRAADSS